MCETMQETVKVRLTEDMLYDFMLFHTYSKFSGFITNILGLSVVFMGIVQIAAGKIDFEGLSFYIVAGVIFLCVTPLRIKLNARRLMEKSRTLKEPCEYVFGENGVTCRRGEKETLHEWDGIIKMVATPKTIGIYYSTDDALIIPKYAFESRFMNVMKIVSLHVPREKVKFG